MNHMEAPILAIDESAAREIADRFNQRHRVYHGLTEVISDHVVIREYGWVFFVTTKEYIKTGDANYILCGGGGILVLRETSDVFLLGGSSIPLEESLAVYEADPAKFVYENAPDYMEAKRLFLSGKMMYEDWKDPAEAANYFARSYALRGDEMFQGEDPKYLALLTRTDSK